MSKAKDRHQWYTEKCPRGCGALWHWYVYEHGSGPMVGRSYWNRKNKSFSWCEMGNKPRPSVRVIMNKTKTGKARFEVHPKNAGWKPTGRNVPVKRCC